MQRFWKYSGNGNHFVLFDHMAKLTAFAPQHIRDWCDVRFGIGADGVATLSAATAPHAFRFRLWNADGSEAEMCGNAARCACVYWFQKHPEEKQISFVTMNGVYQARFDGEKVWVNMTEKTVGERFDHGRDFMRSFVVDTGVPHLVLQVTNVSQVDLMKVAPPLRHHPQFPKGTNVDFVEALDDEGTQWMMRVFERGVEGETWSCGTGVSAVAWAAKAWHPRINKVQITTPGGVHEVLWDEAGLWYAGNVKLAFEGTLP